MAETMVKKIRQAVKSVAGKKAAVSVDYPREGEIIAFPQYSLRFNAPAAALKSRRRSTRRLAALPQSGGLLVAGLAGYDDGEYEVMARAKRLMSAASRARCACSG